MTTYSRTVVAAALLALGASGSAHAAAEASAEIGTVTITLIDLDLTDGIAPALTFLGENSSSYAQTSSGVYSSDYAAGFYQPTSASSMDALSSASGATSAGGASATAQTAGSSNPGVSQYAYGGGYGYANFELTAWTGVILSTTFAGSASTTVGYDGLFSEYAQASGYLQLTLSQDGGYEYHAVQRYASASYVWDGSQYVGQSSSVTGELRLSYANFSGDTVTGYYYAQASADAQSAIGVVPEPGTYGLLLAGLLGIGAVVRRRHD